MKEQLLQSNNYTSLMIYSGGHATQAATDLADRNYGSYIEGLGYLSSTSDTLAYWTNYPGLKFEESVTEFSKLGQIYNESYLYMKGNNEINSSNLSITDIHNNGKTVSRYHAEYSYQTDLNNSFGNIVPKTVEDLNNFLFGLNYQKYNKMRQYGGDVEVSAIRIGPKTFNWHYADEVAYTNVVTREAVLTYLYAYTSTTSYTNSFENSSDVNAVIGKMTEENNGVAPYTYSYEYDGTVDDVFTYKYWADNYYTYIGKQYLPIIDTLAETMTPQIAEFTDKYDNNEDIYTYYMYDCVVDIPMTLTTMSVGVKKSTFEMRYTSEYDHWLEDSIPLKMNFSVSDMPVIAEVTAYEPNTFGVRYNQSYMFSGIDDVVLEAGESHLFKATDENFANSTDTIISLTSPNSIKKLDMSKSLKYISGRDDDGEIVTTVLDLTYSGWPKSRGVHMTELVIGSEDVDPNYTKNISKVRGINDLTTLEKVDISNLAYLTFTPAITNLTNLTEFKAKGSNIKSFKPAANTHFDKIELPDTITNLRLVDFTLNEDGVFDYIINENLSSLVLNNVEGLDTFEFVKEWNTVLKDNNKLIPNSLIYLELSGINWEDIDVMFLKDLKRHDLQINEGTIEVKGSGIYDIITREEYMEMTKLYGLEAFKAGTSNKYKVYPGLDLVKKVPFMQKHEYTFDMTTAADETGVAVMQFIADDAIVPVNALIEYILSNPTITFEYDSIENNNISHKLSNVVDTKDNSLYTMSNITVGDVVLYNGDTIIIYTDTPRVNPSYQYIKVGTIKSMNVLKGWFRYDSSAPITFAQHNRPEIVNEIIITNLDTDTVEMQEGNSDDSIIVETKTDNQASKLNVIGCAAYDKDGNITNDINISKLAASEEHPEITSFKMYVDSTKSRIGISEEREYDVVFYLDMNLRALGDDYAGVECSLELKNVVKNTIHVHALSNSKYEDSVITLNAFAGTYDDETQTITLNNAVADGETIEIL